MLSTKKLCFQMVGIEAGGAFLSVILLFSYRMITANDSPIQWVCYLGGAFTTLAYIALIYGWMWQRGNKDANREVHAPGCYGKNRALIVSAAMLIPNLAVMLFYIYAFMEKLAGSTDGFIVFAEFLRTAWFAPFFEWMYPLATGENSATLFPLLILFVFPAPIVSYVAYKLGHADKSVKGLLLKIFPEKKKSENFPDQNSHNAKDILTEENYRNIYSKKHTRNK